MEKEKEKYVEGLRGLASINVFLHHFLIGFFPGAFVYLYPGLQHQDHPGTPFEMVLAAPLLNILWNGEFAVWIFFVLSGYVLTLPYYQGRNLAVLRQRALCRWLRLGIPCSVTILISFALLKLGCYYHHRVYLVTGANWLNLFFNSEPSTRGLLKEVVFGLLMPQCFYNPPLWTISIEFIGSLIILSFYSVQMENRRWLSIAIFIVVTFFLFPGRYYYFDAFLLGSIIKTLPQIRQLPLLSLIFLFGCLFGSYNYRTFFSLLDAIPATFLSPFHVRPSRH